VGIGCVFVFWSLVGCVLLAVFFALHFVGKRIPIAALFKKVMLAAICAIAIPVALIGVTGYALDFLPSHVFRSSFGFAPTSDVVELKGRKFAFGDSADAYLRFRANKVTVDRIIGDRFEEVSSEQRGSNGFENAPDYWQPPRGRTMRFYHSSQLNDGFGWNQAVLAYDEQTGTVYFYWTGVD
jgi:hypothetical protein